VNRIARTVTAVLLMAAGATLSACTTPAAIVVTTTADTVADDGVTSLREAFAIAGGNAVADTIVLAEHTYNLNNCADGALDHTGPATLTVAGGNATIRQTCTDRGIIAGIRADSTLVIDAVTLVGGPSSGATVPGAGIAVRGALVVAAAATVTGVNPGPGGTVVEGDDGPATDDVTVRGRIVDNAGTAIGMHGGGVRVERGTIARNGGDGVRLDGTSRFTGQDATIEANTGWGVHSTGTGASQVTGDETTISSNGLGGAFCSGCVELSFSGSTISNNSGSAPEGGTAGGGLVLLVHQDDPADAPRLHLTGTTVQLNYADRAGGGVFVGIAVSSAPTAPPAETTIEDSSVTSNGTLGDDHPGGGIAVTTGNLTIVRSTVSGNFVTGVGTTAGGGVYFAEAPDDGIEAPFSFRSERAELNYNSLYGGPGGGAYIVTEGAVDVHGSVIRNTATQGGGLYLATDADLHDSYIVRNTAYAEGGGVYVAAGGSVTDTLVRDNTATTDGGGIYAGVPDGDTLSIDSTTVTANTASGRGGGIAAVGPGHLDVTNATVTENSAPAGGGLATGDAAGLVTSPVSLDHVTIAGNRSAGGANVAADSGPLRLFASLVVEPLGGGANCSSDPAALAPHGYSFLADTSCGVHPTDTVSAEDPQLGTLRNNSGPTPTRLPAPTSPIGGTVPAGVCTIDTDQRSVVRPQGTGCEPGSVEITEASPTVRGRS
jgi:predicted outer membrane repeat protein